MILRRIASSSHHFNSAKCLFDIIFLSRKRGVERILQEEITFSVNFIRGQSMRDFAAILFFITDNRANYNHKISALN